MKHLLTLKEFSTKEILDILDLANKIKKNPGKYKKKLKGKSLLMIFSKPSLRTNLSFNVGIFQLGGQSIFYNLAQSTLGAKEAIKDFSKVDSRYVDIVMARLYEHKDMEELAKFSDVPVINGLDNDYHPCQALGDILTIKDHFKNYRSVKITYLGDANNNVTHSLIIICSKLGIPITISCPNNKEFLPNPKIVEGLQYTYEKDPKKAVSNANIIYTDTWMSYNIKQSAHKKRVKALKMYQVNENLFNINKNALFMHCLPAKRGEEVTDGVIDSERSIVYDQAENRLHAQKAVLLKLLGK